jgi:TolB-like protein
MKINSNRVLFTLSCIICFAYSSSLASMQQTKTLAVLYFHNNSKSPKLDPLQKGLADLLIADLSHCNNLIVVERIEIQKILDELKLNISALSNKQTCIRVGKILQAQVILLGSFYETEDILRIDARLIEVPTARIINAFKVSGKIKSISRLEKDLASQIIKSLHINARPFEKERMSQVDTESLDALLSYSRALDFEDRNLLEKALSAYRNACKIDPRYERARSRLQIISNPHLSNISQSFREITSIILHDLDNDGQKEIIIGTHEEEYTFVLHILETGTFRETGRIQGRKGTGPVTSYVSTFFVAAGDVNGDGDQDIIVGGAPLYNRDKINGQLVRGSISVFDSLTHTLLWESGDIGTVEGLTVGDINGDETAEIITYNSNNIEARDGKTHTVLWKLGARSKDPPNFYMAKMILDDINNDGRKELIALNEWGWLYVLDGLTGKPIHQLSRSNFGAGCGLSVADVDGDGNKEIIVSTASSGNYYGTGEGYLCIYDAQTLKEKWQKKLNVRMGPITVDDTNGDGRKEIILACDAEGAGQLQVYDGEMHFLWEKIGPVQTGIGSFLGVQIEDLDKDGIKEIFASGGCGSSSHNRIYTFNLSKNERLLESEKDILALMCFAKIDKSENTLTWEKGLCKMLATDLVAKSGMQVMEPDAILKYLKENQYNQLKYIDPVLAQRIGKIIKAGWIVLGDLEINNHAYGADLRLLKVQSGEIIKLKTDKSYYENIFTLEENIANQIINQLAKKRTGIHSKSAPVPPKCIRKTLAILPFENYSGTEMLTFFAKGFADMLTTNLSSVKELSLVERQRINEILNELEISQLGTFERKDVLRIGKILGVDYILTGSCMQVKNQIRVDCHMLDMQTGLIVTAHKSYANEKDIIKLVENVSVKIIESLDIKLTTFEKKKLSIVLDEYMNMLKWQKENPLLESHKAYTLVQGEISRDTRWTVNESPYLLTGNVIVKYNVTLTIDPGVTVKFSSAHQRLSLIVHGSLKAEGTSAQMITFTTEKEIPDQKDYWECIRFISYASDPDYQSVLKYCKIQFAEYAAVDIQAYTGKVTIDNCWISNAGEGVIDISEHAKKHIRYITHNLIENSKCAIRVAGPPMVVISSNIIRNNRIGFLVFMRGPQPEGRIQIKQNSIYGNDSAIVYRSSNYFEKRILKKRVPMDDLPALDVTQNWWGTMKKKDIRPLLKGKIKFLPIQFSEPENIGIIK